MATGEIRAAFSMSEPDLGSDVAAIRTAAQPDGTDYVINGQKMWLTNGASANLVALLARTPEGAARPHAQPDRVPDREGQRVRDDPARADHPRERSTRWGTRGWIPPSLLLDGCRVPAARVLGELPGQGFYQMMDGIEVGRVNVAARACGVAQRAFELAITYAQQRQTFGKPIARHQAIEFKLAEMGTKVMAAHQMMVMAARRKDRGEQSDLEAGMAKYLASEYCKEVVEDALRIHGGYGYSQEYEIERLYRDAPMLLIGEGTAEIQKMIIGRRLLERFKIASG